jgi:hypothetical protein
MNFVKENHVGSSLSYILSYLHLIGLLLYQNLI